VQLVERTTLKVSTNPMTWLPRKAWLASLATIKTMDPEASVMLHLNESKLWPRYPFMMYPPKSREL